MILMRYVRKWLGKMNEADKIYFQWQAQQKVIRAEEIKSQERDAERLMVVFDKKLAVAVANGESMVYLRGLGDGLGLRYYPHRNSPFIKALKRRGFHIGYRGDFAHWDV